jgi:hypothetical protein
MNTQKNPEKNVFGFASMAIVAALLFWYLLNIVLFLPRELNELTKNY